MTLRTNELSLLIHQAFSIYIGFDPSTARQELRGWDSEHEWFRSSIEELHPTTVIEVGSFLGASAIHMASILHELQLDSCLICIDTWLGDRQLWLRPEHRATLNFSHGRPEIYDTFLANVIDAQLQDYILPVSMPSSSAARYMKKLGVSADLIYIDGSHDDWDAYNDIQLYWGLLNAGGIMLIDDYVPNTNNNEMFWGVIQSVGRFAREYSLPIENLGRKALLRKAP